MTRLLYVILVGCISLELGHVTRLPGRQWWCAALQSDRDAVDVPPVVLPRPTHLLTFTLPPITLAEGGNKGRLSVDGGNLARGALGKTRSVGIGEWRMDEPAHGGGWRDATRRVATRRGPMVFV